MARNKYSKFFNKNMTTSEARCVYFALHTKDTPESERKLIHQAYKPISDYLIEKEFKLAEERVNAININ